jgi:predicted AAA+ superfamily ATPase
MLVGATGTGKSTLVDGMINYVLGVNWSDPYRLTLVDLEDEEMNRDTNQVTLFFFNFCVSFFW